MDSFDLRHRTTLVKLRELRYRASDSSLLCDVVFSPLNFCFQSCYQFSCNVISFLGKNIICSQEKYFSRKDCLWELSRTFEKCFSPSHEIMSIYLCLSLPREHLKKNLLNLNLLQTSIILFQKLAINKTLLISSFPRCHFLMHIY